jgi:ubiquinone/menaquinone biosynthesis C-methylase UbiE
MLLNTFEKALMNNPVRAAIQRRFEMPRFLSMGGRMKGGRALEVGCGRGVGTELILELSGAVHVDAFDLDPDMVVRARRRLKGGRARIWVGDVCKIDAEAQAYDAVFDFGIIHHVPDWRDALCEIHRVLKPGGRLYAMEVLDRLILHPVWRRLLDHPLEDRFDHDTFSNALESVGLKVSASRKMGCQFAWFIANKSA